MNIKWNGDMENEPKVGFVVSEANEMLTIQWSDGSKMVVPSFTVNARYGWSRW